MQKSKFLSVLQRIESDEITTSELSALFHEMLHQGLSADQKLALCRQLAEQQYDYAATADPRLEGWITGLAKALKAAGANEHIVQEVSAALLIGTYLHDAKFAYTPKHRDSTALTITLHTTFFAKSYAVKAGAAAIPQQGSFARLIFVLTGHPGFLWKSIALVTVIMVALILIHIPGTGRPALCPKNSVAVYGERFLPLPDGSELILANSGTSVCFAYPFYSNGIREVAIRRGSTYCEITADAQNPFILRAPGDIVTEVVERSGLNIDVDEEKQVVDISVSHGKALVRYDGKSHEIVAGQHLSFVLHAKVIHTEIFDPSRVTWPYPQLIFDNVTLEEFARIIEQHYHVSVVFTQEALKKTRITAQFQTNAVQLQQIIHALDVALGDIDLTLNETTLKISRKHEH